MFDKKGKEAGDVSLEEAGVEAAGEGVMPSPEASEAPVESVPGDVPTEAIVAEAPTAPVAEEPVKDVPPVVDTAPKAEQANTKPAVEVDSVIVEFIHSVEFTSAGNFYNKRTGEKMKVSKALYAILYERGCIKPVV